MTMTGMQLSKYEYLEETKISLGLGVKEMVEKRKEKFEKPYRIGVCAGIPIPLIFASFLVSSINSLASSNETFRTFSPSSRLSSRPE